MGPEGSEQADGGAPAVRATASRRPVGRSALAANATCAFACGGLATAVAVCGLWLWAQAVFNDPLSTDLEAAVRLCLWLSAAVLAPMSVGGALHSLALLGRLSSWRARIGLLALNLAAFMAGAAVAAGLYKAMSRLNDLGVL